jgi:hypothetical protein
LLHRPPDFGFRLAQTPINAPDAVK